jgi:predicted Ser/Thr protein kinase
MEEGSRHKLKLHSKLGAGAFGIVYKGTYDGTEVAVKTLAKADDRDAKHCFFREARTMERLCHK